KRAHDNSLEYDGPPYGLPRKKFISEESFAREMAAMTLDPMHPQVYQFTEDPSSEPEFMSLDANGQVIIDVDENGLPMEIRPGENKPRIPNFVLGNPELTDPRDILAYQNILKALNHKPHKHIAIEVFFNSK
ncbi:hypothetical protein INT47_002583, partial [Mucor saturninus]